MSSITYKLDGIYNLLKESYSGSPFLAAIIAGGLASLGLSIDSASTIVASTLISPIGTFIIQANLLSFLKKNKYKGGSIDNLTRSPWYIPVLLIIITTLLISYAIGYLFIHVNNPFSKEPLNKHWPTKNMIVNADPMTALYNIPIALLCGILLPIIVINNNSTGFVAIGVACSLIPPLANIGLSLNFKYNPMIHKPELKNFQRNAVLTGFAIFIINLLLLLIPSRLLGGYLLKNNNIFEQIESVFGF